MTNKNNCITSKKTNAINKVFLTAFFIDIAALIAIAQLTDAANSTSLYIGVFYGSFTDFFDTVLAGQNNPYDVGVIYPPLCYLLCKVMGGMIPGFMDYTDSFALRDSQMGRMVYTYFVVFCAMTVFFVIVNLCKYNNLYKIILWLTMLLSVPFLSTVDRGNFLLLATVCVFVFIAFYDSDNKVYKEIALISLAVAAALKIYPAVLGLLLIKKGNLKTVIRTAVYGILLFTLPVFAYDGLDTIREMITNLASESSKNVLDQYSICGRVDMSAVILTFVLMIKNSAYVSYEAVENLAKTVALLFSAEMLIFSFMTEKKWKKVLTLTAIMLILPSFNFQYCLILYLVPLLLFLLSEHTKSDWFYAVPLFIVTVPFAVCTDGFFEGIYGYEVRGAVVLENIAQMIMFVILQIDFIAAIVKKHKKKIKNKIL